MDENTFPGSSYTTMLQLLYGGGTIELKKNIGSHALDKVDGHLKHFIAITLIKHFSLSNEDIKYDAPIEW